MLRWRVELAVLACALVHAPAAVALEQGRDFFYAAPSDTWAGERWPVVVAVASPGDDLRQVHESIAALVAERGAFLVTLVGGESGRLQALVDRAFEQNPLIPGSTILVGQGGMALWCRDEMLRLQRDVAGMLAINPTIGLPTRVAIGPPQSAIILYSDERRKNPSLTMAQELKLQGLRCAAEQVKPEEMLFAIGEALTALLPPTTPRQQLHDPRTDAWFNAIPGYQFVRRDGLFALAEPTNNGVGPRIQIATGGLRGQTFDDYLAQTEKSLRVDGIRIVKQESLSAEGAPIRARAFYFVDQRTRQAFAVYWIQLGRDGQVVSLRSVAPEGQLEPYLHLIRELAMSVTFGTPGPDAQQVQPTPSGDPPPSTDR